MIASAVVLLLLSLLVATEPDHHSGPVGSAQPDDVAPQHPGLPAAADRPAEQHHRAA